MDDKLHNFFTENEFDFHEPHSGHFQRFEKRLQGVQPQKRVSWKWLSVAASVVLLIGFFLGVNMQDQPLGLSDVSPKMQEVETYFVNTINLELKEIEKSRNLDTEKVIENALDQLEELEDHYNAYLKELNENGEQLKIINAMIDNYQKRIEILQNTLQQIEQIKNPKIVEDEIYI